MTIRIQCWLGAAALVLSACAPGPVTSPAKPEPKAGTTTPAPEKTARRITPGELTSIPIDGVFQLQQSGKALIFDARLPLFYRLNHIPGAINLPLSGCEARIQAMETTIKSALAEGKSLITYCSGPSCPDAHTLAQHLSRSGYPVSVFAGGWDSWSTLQNEPIDL